MHRQSIAKSRNLSTGTVIQHQRTVHRVAEMQLPHTSVNTKLTQVTRCVSCSPPPRRLHYTFHSRRATSPALSRWLAHSATLPPGTFLPVVEESYGSTHSSAHSHSCSSALSVDLAPSSSAPRLSSTHSQLLLRATLDLCSTLGRSRHRTTVTMDSSHPSLPWNAQALVPLSMRT